MPWAVDPPSVSPALSHPLVSHIIAVEPSRDGTDLLQRDFGLLSPNGIAHDGWQRYRQSPGASGRLLLYRGNPYCLTPPVLSLAGIVDAMWDR